MENITYILYNNDFQLKNQIIFYDDDKKYEGFTINLKEKEIPIKLIQTAIELNPFKTEFFCFLKKKLNLSNLFPNKNKVYCRKKFSIIFLHQNQFSTDILKNPIFVINKLKNIPQFLWINLDRSEHRQKEMEKLFNQHHLQNIRISGCDGFSSNNFYTPSTTSYSSKIYGCTCSHLKSLEYFVNQMDDEMAIICEDDLSFEYCQYWKTDFNNYLKLVPDNWELILLNVNTPLPMKIEPTKFILDRHNSTGCYLVKRKTAQKILNAPFFTKKDDKYQFNFTGRTDIVADKCLYKYLKHVYVLPLFTYQNENSIIHQNHIGQHQKSKNKILEEWKNHFIN